MRNIKCGVRGLCSGQVMSGMFKVQVDQPYFHFMLNGFGRVVFHGVMSWWPNHDHSLLLVLTCETIRPGETG